MAIIMAQRSISYHVSITDSRKMKQCKGNDYLQWNDLHIQFYEQKFWYKNYKWEQTYVGTHDHIFLLQNNEN
jgi:hypothetical protein